MKKSLQVISTLLFVLVFMTCTSGFQITASAETTENTLKSIADCTITLKTKSYIYDGRSKRPQFTIKDGNYTLSGGKDYTFIYEDNVKIGTAKIIFKGNGNYCGSVAKNFTINKRPISNCTVTLDKTSYTYNGRNQKPKVTIKDGTYTLSPGKDYTYDCYDRLNAGVGRIVVSGRGIYGDEITKPFTINPKSISTCTVTVAPTRYAYTGKAITPTITIKDGNTTLKKNTDYSVKCTNNVNAGTATVVITGKGNYSKSFTTTFTITQKSISACTVTVKPTSYAYTGKAITPTITIKNGSVTLKKNTDYSVKCTNNVNAGTATVVITGKGNYSESVTKTFTITKKSISACTIRLSSPSYVYNCKPVTPGITIKDGNTKLNKNTDYSVKYTNNVNAGTATVVITGKGNYKDSVTKTFTITKKSISACTVTVKPTSYAYTGKAITPTITVKNGSVTLKKNTDYSVKCTNNVNIGAATVVITGTGNYAGSVNEAFNICYNIVDKLTVQVSASKSKGSDGKYHLNNQLKPDYISVKYSDNPSSTIDTSGDDLVEGDDYTIEYKFDDDLNYGTAIIQGKGDYMGKVKRKFAITTFRFGYDNWNLNNDGKVFKNIFDRDTIKNEWEKQESIDIYKSSKFEKRELSDESSWCLDSTVEAFENEYQFSEEAKVEMRKHIYDYRGGEWNGSCTGMTSLNILFLQKDPKLIPVVEELTGKKFTNLHSLEIDKNVISIINYAQMAVGEAKDHNPLNERAVAKNGTNTNYDMISKIEELLRNQDRAVRLSIRTKEYASSDSNHAIMAYGIEDYDYTSPITGIKYDKRILILDPNSGKDRKYVEPNDCIYYNSITHSYIMPYRTQLNADGSYAKSFFWNNDSTIPEEDTTKDIPYGGIKNVSTLGSFTDELFPE